MLYENTEYKITVRIAWWTTQSPSWKWWDDTPTLERLWSNYSNYDRLLQIGPASPFATINSYGFAHTAVAEKYENGSSTKGAFYMKSDAVSGVTKACEYKTKPQLRCRCE